MNKEGFLLVEETLKIIIALIAIGFLAYFLISLYFSAKTSKELDQAKATLPFLIGEIKTGKISVDIYNPKGWVLESWPHQVTSGFWKFKTTQAQMPNSCKNLGLSNCICLCKSDNADVCDSNGVCVNNEGYLIQGSSITIDNPPITLNIDKTNKVISKK